MSESEPEIVQEIHQTANSLEEQVEKLDTFGEKIEDFSTRVDNMGETERQAFYNSAEDLRARIDATESVSDLLSLEEAVEEAIRAPLKQVALAHFDRLLDTLEPDLPDPTKEDIREQLSGWIAQDLEAAAEAYEDIIPTIQSLPDHLTELIAKSVEQTPSRILAPEQELRPQVEHLQARYEALVELDELASETDGLLSEVNFAETERFYEEQSKSIDVSRIEQKVAEIETELDAFEDEQINLRSIVSAELENRLAAAEVTKIEIRVSSLLQDVRSVKRSHSQIVEYIEDIDKFGTTAGLFEDEIDNLLANHTQLRLNQYSSLQHLESSLTKFLQDELDEFFETLHHRLQSQENMMHVLESEDSDPTPQTEFGGDGALLQVNVKENAFEALEACKTNQEWIRKQIEDSSGSADQDTVLNICQTLSEGDAVELTEENKEEILELSDRLPLNVVLRSE